MSKINERDKIIQKISLLQQKQSDDFDALKNQFHETYDSFKPINILKNTLLEVTSTPKSDFIDGAVKLVGGLFANKFLFDVAEKPIKKIVKNIFQFVVKKFSSEKS